MLGANTTPAAEGAVGTSNVLTTTTVSGTVSEYADFITVSTLLDETAIDPVVQNAAEQLGYAAGLSVDTIIKAEFDTNSGAVLSPGTLGTYATVDDFRRCKALLEGANVRPKDEKYYYAICHPYIIFDVKSDSTAGGWIDLNNSLGRPSVMKGNQASYIGETLEQTIPREGLKVISRTRREHTLASQRWDEDVRRAA